MAEDQKELQFLLPSPNTTTPSSSTDPLQLSKLPSSSSMDDLPPSLDLQLSISVVRRIRRSKSKVDIVSPNSKSINRAAQAAAAAEESRLAAIEMAYAERVQELSRREMEVAEMEFNRARSIWERAKEEVEKAERLKERASRSGIDSTCMEITCYSCRQKFRL